jgi:tagatose-1,6-bisphosphate aldolase non-catalytic subunit AgaZ/GatZ
LDNAIGNTLECYKVCEETLKYCHGQGGEHVNPSHIKIMQDCKEACLMAASFMIRESDMHARVCDMCADACLKCADSCEEFTDDEKMKRCAEVCRRCEASCREMAQS